ncbi:MAG: DNRLRE domain-containing protein [Ignavibacteriaceae bacterium]
MFIKRIFLLSVPVILSVFISCSESPTDIGASLLNEDFIGVTQINSLTDSISQSSSSVKQVVPLGISERIFIGKSHNVEAYSLINFWVYISDSLLLEDFRQDRINIISSTVQLANTYEIGDTNASLSFNVHNITSGWTSVGFTTDSLPLLQYNAANIGSNIAITDSFSTFQLDNSTVLSWIKDSEDSVINNDNGIFIAPVSESRIVGFQANSSSTDTITQPQMHVIYERAGDVDTIKFYAYEDVSVIEGEIPDGNNETIYVQAGLTSNAKLWFDLSGIPANSVINFAELTLTLDTIQTVVGNSFTNSLNVYMILDSANIDSITSGFTMSRDGGTFKGNITTIIQAMYTLQTNNGMLIRAGNRADGLELFAIKSSTAADSALRPYLKITYTNKK